VAAGFWQPDPKTLLPRWRDRLATAPDAWLHLAESLAEAGLTLDGGPFGGLKRMPRGYESHADAPVAPFLKWKGYVANRAVPDEIVTTPTFADEVLDVARASLPLLDWGWSLSAGEDPA
jgi:uncharacterized protein (DUF2461 family)